MKPLILLLLLLVPINGFAKPAKKDPFEKIIRGKLPNEMSYFVVSSPQSKLTAVEIYVKTGWEAEKPFEYGVAHLVEHVLFRDNELKDNMSYLQIFKDKGGRVNASVSSRKTKYSVTIPSQHSMWTLELLTKMLQNRTFTESELAKAKQSVMIEIGEPSPIEKVLKFTVREWLEKIFPFQRPSFFKDEFGVDFYKYKQPLNGHRLKTPYLSLAQTQSFYKSFYIPKNIQIFVAGNFNSNQVIHFINKKWTNYKKEVKGKQLPPTDKPKMIDRPFYSIKHSRYPSMQLGVKVANISLKDLFILKSYTKFIADKIMKDVRNKKGETYTAHAGNYLYKGHGKIYINMDSTPKAFKRNLKILKHLLFEKPQKENIEKSLFDKAKLDLKHSFKSSYEEDAGNLLYNLYLAEKYKRRYKFTGSPVQLIENISLEDYKNTLKKYINPEKYIIQKYPKYFLFYYESFLINFIFLILSILLVRRIIKKPFDHFQIRFVKNIKVLPFKIYELGLIVISLVFTSILYIAIETYIFYNNKLLQSHLITGDYLPSVITIVLFVIIFMFLLSISPRKIYLTDDSLYIKSMTYRIKKIPAGEIEKFESIKCWKIHLSLKTLWNIGYRSYMYRRACPWKSVLLVHLKNGKMILLDCGLTERISKKFNDWLFSLKAENK